MLEELFSTQEGVYKQDSQTKLWTLPNRLHTWAYLGVLHPASPVLPEGEKGLRRKVYLLPRFYRDMRTGTVPGFTPNTLKEGYLPLFTQQPELFLLEKDFVQVTAQQLPRVFLGEEILSITRDTTYI
jgi:hypothetical protein